MIKQPRENSRLFGEPDPYVPRRTRGVAERLEERAPAADRARELMYTAVAGEQFTPDDSIRIEVAALVARENAKAAVDRLFSIRGAHGLFETSNFERYYRDVRIGTLHAVSTPDFVRELVGKHLFGVPADIQPRWG